MKLKQFMTNSLPRSKNKKKKQQKHLSPTTTTPETNSLSSQPTTPSGENNQQLLQEVEQSNQSDSVTLNKSLVTEDFEYLNSKLAPVEENEQYINFNISVTSSKCGCYKHIEEATATEKTESPTKDKRRSFECRFSFTDDSNFNTLPRVRSRIKTNPWLPSPRSSPCQTPSSSPHSSVSASPMTSPMEQMSFGSYQESSSVSQTETISPEVEEFVLDPPTEGQECDTAVKETDITEPYLSPRNQLSSYDMEHDVLQQSFTSCDTDNSITANEHYYFPGMEEGRYDHSSCEFLDGDDVEYILENKDKQPQISFEYEEDFESKMENRSVGQYVSSRDDLQSSHEGFYSSRENMSFDLDSKDDVFSEASHDLFESESESESEYSIPANKEFSWGLHNGDSIETDDTLCESENINPLKPTRLFPSFDEDKENYSYDHTYVFSDKEESFDSAFESGAYGSESSQGRSAYEIKMSLQEKVNRLREEKSIVDEKIRQAQEEDRLRIQEKMRFQKQITMYRKQILLRTLQDLKSKLENQSQRLQSTYNNVLTMQRNYTKQKKMKALSQANGEHKEAPF